MSIRNNKTRITFSGVPKTRWWKVKGENYDFHYNGGSGEVQKAIKEKTNTF